MIESEVYRTRASSSRSRMERQRLYSTSAVLTEHILWIDIKVASIVVHCLSSL